MDSIKKKMEKLANETAEAEARIAHFEDIKSANEAEAERYEEHVRNIQKKMQVMESSFDVCTEDLFNQTVKLDEMEKNLKTNMSQVYLDSGPSGGSGSDCGSSPPQHLR